jgi:hypothetical protein
MMTARFKTTALITIGCLTLSFGTAAVADEAPWRNIRLDSAGDWRLALSGELRERYETVSHPDFGLDASYDDVWLHRLTLETRLSYKERTTLFLQLGNWEATERRTGNPPTDRNSLDLAQVYMDVRLPWYDEVSVRGGRQEMSFGSSRLVSVRESPNVRRSFDGVSLTWKHSGYTASSFLVRPVELNEGAFDDRRDSTQLFGGFYLTSPELKPTSFDFYYLALERDEATFFAGGGHEVRHSLGARLFGQSTGWDWDWEAVGQVGSLGADNIRAWTVATDTGYTFEHLMWTPRVGLKADIASGDGDPRDGTLETFNALFPKVPYFSEAGLVYPANVMDLQPTLTLRPYDTVEVGLSWNVLWRQSSMDAFYQPPLVAINQTAGSGTYIGNQGQVSLQWTPTPAIELNAWLVHFDAGETINRAGGHDVTYGAVSISYKF